MPNPSKQSSRSEKRKLNLTKAELESEETKKPPPKTRRSGQKSSGMEPPKIQSPGQKTRIGSFRTEISEALNEKGNIPIIRADYRLKREDFYSIGKNAEKENAHEYLKKLRDEADEGETPKHLLPVSSDQECLKITLKNNRCTTCQEPKGKCQGFRINLCLIFFLDNFFYSPSCCSDF